MKIYQNNIKIIKRIQQINLIKNQQIEQQEKVFQEFSEKNYETISQQFLQYQLKTDYEQEFKNKFIGEWNKQSLNNLQSNVEKKQIITMFKKELKQNQQFKILESMKGTMLYVDIFHLPLEDKIKDSSNQNFINIGQYYCYQLNIEYITKQNLLVYLNLQSNQKQKGQTQYNTFIFDLKQQIQIYKKKIEKNENFVQRNTQDMQKNEKEIFPHSWFFWIYLKDTYQPLNIFQKNLTKNFNSLYPSLKIEFLLEQFDNLDDLMRYSCPNINYIIYQEEKMVPKTNDEYLQASLIYIAQKDSQYQTFLEKILFNNFKRQWRINKVGKNCILNYMILLKFNEESIIEKRPIEQNYQLGFIRQ